MRLGLRGKLIIVFFIVAVVPHFIVMFFASRQGDQILDMVVEFREHDTSIETSLEQYEQQLQVLNQKIQTWVQQHTLPEDSSFVSEFNSELEKIFREETASLQDLRTSIQQEYTRNTEQFTRLFDERQIFFLVIILIVAVVATVGAFVFGEILTRPILELTGIARKIAQGDIDHLIRVRAKNELGQLSEAFIEMSAYMKSMAAVANKVATGNLSKMLPPKSSRDLLGKAFHTMEQYLRDIGGVANQIANGKLMYTIPVKSSDDFLGNTFQKMRTNLADTLRQIKGEVQVIEHASETAAQRSEQDMKMAENVLSSAEETSSSMMEMQASVEEVSENMKTLSVSIEETVASIEETTMAIQRIAGNSTGLSNSAEETFGVIQEIGRAIERLVETSNQAENSSRHASESAHAGQVSVREIIEGMKVIHDVVSTAGEMIKALGSRSEEIGSITNVITEIADQTSLLALNASIIAAQAGEHGRGFAVVAEEVKELANRSSNAAKEIEGLIKGVQAESQKAVESMEKGRDAVENGVLLANRGGEALDVILSSVESALKSIAQNTRIAHEQALLSEQVRKYMENVVAMVNEIARSTDEQQQGAAQIMQSVGIMRNLSEQVNRATTEQTRGTHHVLEAMDSVTMRVQESSIRAQELAKFSAELAHETHTLMGLLEQFDVGTPENAIVPNPSSQVHHTLKRMASPDKV